MSNSSSRHSRPGASQLPTPATPSSSSSSTPSSKLPKFMQPKATNINRDRSKSLNESFAYASAPETTTPLSSAAKGPRKSLKLLASHKERSSTPLPHTPPLADTAMVATPGEEDAPIIIEPPSASSSNTPQSSRSRTSSERPLSPATLYSSHSVSNSSRVSDLPTRLSGWFSHTFSTSSTDLSLPTLLSQSHISSSPHGGSPYSPTKSTGKSALLTAAKHGKGHLDKAMRYLLDSDSTPDKCPDPIWLLGVQHPGYEPPPPPSALSSSTSSSSGRRSLDAIRRRGSPNNSIKGASQTDLSVSQPPTSAGKKGNDPGANWPPVFYADFTSRVWVTYRSQFSPIRDQRLNDLPSPCSPAIPSSSISSSETYTQSHYHRPSISPNSDSDASQVSASPPTKRWNWPSGLGGGEKGWTSDAGWGCMLRTGQSLLANALLYLHLGRDFRIPNPSSPAIAVLTSQLTAQISPAQYASYIRILTWFLDTPSPQCPFSVHRLALAGKELGKDVGMWFGPSTAAGGIKILANSFPDAKLGVVVAEGIIFECDVYNASRGISETRRAYGRRGRSSASTGRGSWGENGVLILIPTRLGIDGVNPVYYDTIKALYSWSQSVGIAGGRPSSSYYFIGSQADNLFYLDPHHARPSVPLRPFPPTAQPTSHSSRPSHSSSASSSYGSKGSYDSSTTDSYSSEWGTSADRRKKGGSKILHGHTKSPTSPPASVRTVASSSTTSSGGQYRFGDREGDMDIRELYGLPILSPPFERAQDGELDAYQEHLITSYSPTELRTFHCDRVRKMPLSGLDPSMLIGFLCRNEKEWIDLRAKIGELPKKAKAILSVQDEPPNWPSDSDDIGLESISEPDDDALIALDDDEEDQDALAEQDDDGEEEFFDTRSISSTSARGGKARSGNDTEEDPVDPITPGPGSKFDLPPPMSRSNSSKSEEADNEIEDDWIDPTMPTSHSEIPISTIPAVVHQRSSSNKSSKSASATSTSSSIKKKKQVPVPVPQVVQHYPFPVSVEDDDYSDGGFPVVNEDAIDSSGQHSTGRRQTTKTVTARNNAAANAAYSNQHSTGTGERRARNGGRTQSGGVKAVFDDE